MQIRCRAHMETEEGEMTESELTEIGYALVTASAEQPDWKDTARKLLEHIREQERKGENMTDQLKEKVEKVFHENISWQTGDVETWTCELTKVELLAFVEGLQRDINTKELVNRFLAWQLPTTVCSDTCVTMPNYPHQRSGTNLLTANEAKQMIEYLFSELLAFFENFIQNCENSERLDSVQTVYFCNWAKNLIGKEITPLPAEKNVVGVRIQTNEHEQLTQQQEGEK
jgi:hypothetical protein